MNISLRLLACFLFVFSLPVYSDQQTIAPFDVILKSTLKKSGIQDEKIDRLVKDRLKPVNHLLGVSKINVAKAYSALSIYSDAADYSGSGNVAYWLRVTEDFTRLSWAMGKVYSSLANSISNKTVRTAVSNIGLELQNMEAGERGNVTYWRDRAQYVGDEIYNKSKQVRHLTANLNDEMIDLKPVVTSIGVILLSFDVGGTGKVDYWVRVATDMELLAKAGVQVIQKLSGLIDADIAGILMSYAYRLDTIDAGGRGDVTYWRDKADGIAVQLDGIGNGIVEVGMTL